MHEQALVLDINFRRHHFHLRNIKSLNKGKTFIQKGILWGTFIQEAFLLGIFIKTTACTAPSVSAMNLTCLVKLKPDPCHYTGMQVH